MRKRSLYFLLITILLGVFISPIASSKPDGLERVAHDLGFIEMEKEPFYLLFPDYSITFISLEYMSTALTGLIGIIMVGILTSSGLWIVKKLKARKSMINQEDSL